MRRHDFVAGFRGAAALLLVRWLGLSLCHASDCDRSNFRPPDLIDFSMTPNRRLSAVRCQETEFRWC